MRRVLVLTYDYPPCSAPGAAVRSQKLAQYLPEFRWEALVVCRQERVSARTEEPPSDARTQVVRVPAPISPRLSYQLEAWSWANRMRPRAQALIRESRPDVIYASCPPFPHALSAVRLARKAGVPLVVDFRDSWSLDPHLSGGLIKQSAKRALCGWIYPRLERRVIESADAIIMNTPSMRREYVRVLEPMEQRLHFVPNGFDETDFCDPIEPPARERPLLLYCGRLLDIGGRSPDLLLDALRAVIGAGRRFDLEILGDDSEALRRSIRRFGLEGYVRTRASVSNREAVRAVRQADILVVCQARSRTGVTPVAGKTFEYLRSGRPILAVVPPGDNADLVRRHAAIHALVTTEDSAQLAAAIHDLLDRVADGIRAVPDVEFVEQYSRRGIAGRIAAIFDAALNGS